jgi:hypothetical protein
MADATSKSDDPQPVRATPLVTFPVIHVAGTMLSGVAAFSIVAEPLTHHNFGDCNPRVELCRASDLWWLPDGPHHHWSGAPLGDTGLVIVATSTSANSTTLLSTTVLSSGALKSST